MVNTVALVVPCFNEAARWDAPKLLALASLPAVLLVLVDDGSKDDTGRLMNELSGVTGWVVLSLGSNSGKAEAVRHGLLHALDHTDAEIVGFLDADGAFDPQDVERMITLAEGRLPSEFDALWSSRVAMSGRRIQRRASRHYIGRGVATALSFAYPELPYDSQSGFKLFARSPSLAKCLDGPFRTRWLFEVEMLLRWRLETGHTMRLWEEPVMSWRDVPGSKIRGRETIRIMQEIVTVIGTSRRSRP